jgi:hypothetical protein
MDSINIIGVNRQNLSDNATQIEEFLAEIRKLENEWIESFATGSQRGIS